MKITIGKTTIDIDPTAILYARRSLTYVSQSAQSVPGMDRREALKAAAALTRLHAALLNEREGPEVEAEDNSEEAVPRRKPLQERVFTGMPQGVRAFVEEGVKQRLSRSTVRPSFEHNTSIRLDALLEAMEELEHGYDNLADDIRSIDGYLCGRAESVRGRAEAARENSAQEAFAVLRRLGYEI